MSEPRALEDLFVPARGEEIVAAGPLRAIQWRPRADLIAPATFVLVHGIWVGAHLWRRLGPYLADHGYATYALWLRHHHPGAEHGQLHGLGVGDYIDDVRAALRAIGRPILVGHSLGGLVALGVAAHGGVPGVAVLSSAAPRGIPTIHRGRLNLVAAPHFVRSIAFRRSMPMPFAYARRTYLSHLDDAEAAALHPGQVPMPWRVAAQAAVWPPQIGVSDLTCPVFVGTGAEDRAIIPWVAHRIARRFRVVPTIYPGRGHMIHVESGWEAVADDLMRWANRLIE